ncbi:alternative ribosome rescue aminoacyl-tRNA hydrolase ArfB [Desulfonatronovibrio hydrogenovorans]|uniref:alternative ribosome rescue aminoacyl-tRNA hydrolase ArfB n=1 Tax=Desulfonatronovibrio hydrogenovorans TaxID=53245 RepID=UPI00048B61EF|nr:alternative ribosome rescue aminoacyl-tRNA hydrolase ArfB [Desulfonatronovibrio hydrogenovorans]
MQITDDIHISESELDFQAVRARGPGGQNVNKVSSAVHLFFDIQASSLPEPCKQRLLGLRDRRINSRGVVVIKAGRSRSREKNIQEARERLKELILKAVRKNKPRRPTRPTRVSRQKRLDQKTGRSRIKQMRQRVEPE